MINLIAPDIKRSYVYAQLNQKLIKWVMALVIGLIGIGLIGTYGWISLHQSIKNNNHKIAAIQSSLNRADLVQTEAKVQTISNDFTLVYKVLSQEVLFSKLLSKIASTLPKGTNLTSLSISNTAKGSGLDITADAENYNLATQVQINLADPANGIFSKADLENINCTSNNNTSSSSASNAYPCSVNIRALFAQNNQFLFINQGVSK